MHRGEEEPYNPYPEEGGSPRRGHHHHHFGHHQSEEGPQYGSNLEHRPPPPPSRPGYGDSPPHGYGEEPYGQERRPGPHEEQRYGGYEDRNNTSQYPPGPNPYGNPAAGKMGAYPSSGFEVLFFCKVMNFNVIMLRIACWLFAFLWLM